MLVIAGSSSRAAPLATESSRPWLLDLEAQKRLLDAEEKNMTPLAPLAAAGSLVSPLPPLTAPSLRWRR